MQRNNLNILLHFVVLPILFNDSVVWRLSTHLQNSQNSPKFKKSNKNDINCYRPISIFYTMLKMLEKFVCTRQDC